MSSDHGSERKEIRRVSVLVMLWQLLFGYDDEKQDETEQYKKHKEHKNGKSKTE